MTPRLPRLVVAGTGGDAGKTLVSLALAAAWRARGHAVAAFKKGPDYIDRAWLSWAADGEARNLDAYLMPEPALLSSFAQGAAGVRVTLVEGNRGLYDGLDGAGTYSTAELAKALSAPVVLLLDATKVTRTAAAVALGMQRMDPSCPLRAVVLNRVRGARHERVITEAVRQATGLPVLGVIPRDPELASLLPDRHLGLVPPAEHVGTARLGTRLAALAEQALDLDGLLRLADAAPPLSAPPLTAAPQLPDGPPAPPRVRVGVFQDRAFTFYYPENLEALRQAGAELVPIRPTRDPALPAVDALYLGGGFPEIEAAALAANVPLRAAGAPHLRRVRGPDVSVPGVLVAGGAPRHGGGLPPGAGGHRATPGTRLHGGGGGPRHAAFPPGHPAAGARVSLFADHRLERQYFNGLCGPAGCGHRRGARWAAASEHAGELPAPARPGHSRLGPGARGAGLAPARVIVANSGLDSALRIR